MHFIEEPNSFLIESENDDTLSIKLKSYPSYYWVLFFLLQICSRSAAVHFVWKSTLSVFFCKDKVVFCLNPYSNQCKIIPESKMSLLIKHISGEVWWSLHFPPSVPAPILLIKRPNSILAATKNLKSNNDLRFICQISNSCKYYTNLVIQCITFLGWF